jgi:Cellulase (glycosyl hydrolase family 5)
MFMNARICASFLLLILLISTFVSSSQIFASTSKPLIGVDLLGYYTAMPQSREIKNFLPENYYDDSFRLISQAGMNHIRYVFYWESYVKDPIAFMNELLFVANSADKYGLKVIYDNHQFHTSSWLNPQRGTGFPTFLFQNDTHYQYGSGGGTKYPAAAAWWQKWWNRGISDSNGIDGWLLQAQFLKNIIKSVDSHPSTIGYEILSEPQIHNVDEWEKIKKYNTFMVDELRTATKKDLIISMTIPVDLKSPIGVTSDNLAKMIPSNQTGIVFKFSLYGIPSANTYQEERLNIFVNTGRIAHIPIYIGEWNNVARQASVNQEGDTTYEINPQASDITPEDTSLILKKFSEFDIYGWAFWYWNFRPHKVDNFNLVTLDANGNLQPTKYYNILKNAISAAYK